MTKQTTLGLLGLLGLLDLFTAGSQMVPATDTLLTKSPTYVNSANLQGRTLEQQQRIDAQAEEQTEDRVHRNTRTQRHE